MCRAMARPHIKLHVFTQVFPLVLLSSVISVDRGLPVRLLKHQYLFILPRWGKQMFKDASRISQQNKFHVSSGAFSGLEGKKMRKKKKQEPHFYENISPWRTEEDLLNTLTKDNLMHEDDNLIVINKPNCVPMAGAEVKHIPVTAVPSEMVRFSIRSVFPALKEAFHTDYLQPVLSLPRQYSGVMVFVKTEEALKQMKSYFRHVQVQGLHTQKYWVVTLGVPREQTSPMPFAIKKVKVEEDEVSVKVTEYSNQARKKGKVCVGNMQHKVKDTQQVPGADKVKVALVELQPALVKWESIECYFTDQCMCPVLGDHVYSPRIITLMGKKVKLTASRALSHTATLPYDVTKALLFASENLVKHTPLHIHLRELVIPNPEKKKELLTLTAPLPDFYSRTISLLGLKAE